MLGQIANAGCVEIECHVGWQANDTGEETRGVDVQVVQLFLFAGAPGADGKHPLVRKVEFHLTE